MLVKLRVSSQGTLVKFRGIRWVCKHSPLDNIQVSSAKLRIGESSLVRHKPLINVLKSIGSRTDPCWTSVFIIFAGTSV